MQWVRRIGGQWQDGVWSIEVDESENVYVAGVGSPTTWTQHRKHDAEGSNPST